MATEPREIKSRNQSFFGPEMLANPYPIYHLMRSRSPVMWIPQLDAWAVTSYELVSQALRNPLLSSDRFPRTKKRMQEKGLPIPLDDRVKSLIHMDAPDHTRLRGLVNKAFTPQAVTVMTQHIESIVNELFEAIPKDGKFDLIEHVAYPLPITVIAEMLGVPTEDLAQLKRWSDDVSLFLSGDVGSLTPEMLERIVQARLDLGDYFGAIMTARRAMPGDDLLSALIDAEEDGGRLNDDELLSTAILLLVAGNETTTNLIGNGMLALLRHPEEHQRVWGDSSLIPSAVEEMLRFDGPVQLTNRLAKADLEIGGTAIKQGQMVFLMLAAANRDPAQFPDPDRFDVARANNRHLAFGAGPHFCVGAPLARLEAKIMIRTLRDRYPNLRLGEETPVNRENFNLRGLQALILNY